MKAGTIVINRPLEADRGWFTNNAASVQLGPQWRRSGDEDSREVHGDSNVQPAT